MYHDTVVNRLTKNVEDLTAKVDGLTRRLGQLTKEHGDSASDLIKTIARATDLEDELSRANDLAEANADGWKKSIAECSRLRLRVEELERGLPPAPPPARASRVILGALRGALAAVRSPR